MATDVDVSKRQVTPVPAPAFPLPHQKRPLEDDHVPSISSPLNPNPNPNPNPNAEPKPSSDVAAMPREKSGRPKKESLKKRESKGGLAADTSRATPDPKQKDLPLSEASPLRFKFPPPKLSHFEPARSPIFTYHHNVPAPDRSTIEFHETSEHVYNKKSYQYMHCIADPAFPSSYYRQTEPEPYGAHISFEDAATHMYFDQSGQHITTDKGWRMARANIAVRQGRWYWEYKVTRGMVKAQDGTSADESHGHVRVGFARRESSLDAPVGFDAYSYGLRDVQGQKVHLSRPKDFFPEGEHIKEGDVIGLEIQLPSEQLHRKVVQGQFNPAVDLLYEEEPTAEAANIVRDRIPIQFKAHTYFEKIDYHTTKELEDLMNPSPIGPPGSASRSADQPNPNHQVPSLRTLPNSYIKVYKNGVPMGTAFENLLAFLPPASKPQVQLGAREGMDDGLLGYYPAISVFRGGAVQVNFGPKFWYPPPDYVRTTTTTGAARDGGDDDDNSDGDVDMVDTDTVTVGQAGGAPNGAAKKKQDPVRALSERYTDQIVEDVVADVIDEVDFWMQDGARIIDRAAAGRDEKSDTGGGAAPRRAEIKELVQDD
ncbi:hypothetical protein F4778DRAFT_418430 [Xylariomycetidae sp. FL2044]|nr:hypothetical protein F4778DRAFT_418430 [Xylariomycetidae sp. FL2044]